MAGIFYANAHGLLLHSVCWFDQHRRHYSQHTGIDKQLEQKIQKTPGIMLLYSSDIRTYQLHLGDPWVVPRKTPEMLDFSPDFLLIF